MAENKIILVKNLLSMIELEPFILICVVAASVWAFYRIFLTEATEERHKNLRNHHRNLYRHLMVFGALFLITFLMRESEVALPGFLQRSLPYLALLTFAWGMIVFVKSCRTLVLQYLFLGSMDHGVPLLIVNIFSLLLSVSLGIWGLNYVFGVQVAPILATSAAVSIILGLAMQDTLGNLFAGISLQMDQAFEIGDWLEITNGSVKTVGQVKEVSWRSTVLVGWTDELITIPNRTLANAQICNFSLKDHPILRSQSFRMPLDVDSQLVKQCLLESIKEVHSVLKWPEPSVIISETTDSWMNFKMLYYIENYGSQYSVGDKILESAFRYLHANGLQTTPQTYKIISAPHVE